MKYENIPETVGGAGGELLISPESSWLAMNVLRCEPKKTQDIKKPGLEIPFKRLSCPSSQYCLQVLLWINPFLEKVILTCFKNATDGDSTNFLQGYDCPLLMLENF